MEKEYGNRIGEMEREIRSLKKSVADMLKMQNGVSSEGGRGGSREQAGTYGRIQAEYEKYDLRIRVQIQEPYCAPLNGVYVKDWKKSGGKATWRKEKGKYVEMILFYHEERKRWRIGPASHFDEGELNYCYAKASGDPAQSPLLQKRWIITGDGKTYGVTEDFIVKSLFSVTFLS